MPDTLERLTRAVEGRYAVERRWGEGGMATVYLATDLKHGRKVAIKVLKPELAMAVGPDRFLEEIRTTAALQHPHILSLHDSGDADGLLYYVMPFVEGESLRDRLTRERQLAVDDAIGITASVAAGLQAAHDFGVVHRDVKPANILLSAGGPLVADFGIARAHSITGERHLTETGMSLGTPGYMSPEQVTGDHPVDHRADIYAIGCVLYEMLVGEVPFSASTAQGVIARIVSGEIPSARARRSTVPANVDAVIRKALERVPADRFPSAADVAVALADPSFRHGVDAVHEGEGAARRWRLRAIGLGIATAMLAVSLLWVWLGPAPVVTRPLTTFAVPVAVAEGYATGRQSVAVSPDGRHVAFVGEGRGGARLYVRALDELEPRLVPGSVGALDPFFSADGLWIGYATVDALMKVPLSGGVPERIVSFAEPRGVFWADDDQILFGSYAGLWEVGADGEGLTPVSQIREALRELAHTRPEVVDVGDVVLFTILDADDGSEIASLNRVTGEVRTLVRGVSPRYSPSGHLVFGQLDGTLMAAPFDPHTATLTGPAEPVLTGIMSKSGTLDYSLSRNGTLVYLTGGVNRGTLVLVDRNGAEQVLFAGAGELNGPRFSPDGSRVAVGMGSPPSRQVWVYEVDQGTMAPITYEGNNYYATWSHDGSRIGFARETSSSVDVFWKRADGSGDEEPLLQDSRVTYPELWAPDGQTFVVREQSPSGEHDLLTVQSGGDGQTRPYLAQPVQEESPALSPSGRWMAYTSDLSGDLETYVTGYPNPGGRVQVSIGGGTEPVWAPGEDELFYWRGDTLVAATVQAGQEFQVLDRRDLFAESYARWQFHRNYDLHPDGRQFLMVRREATDARRIVVVQNWDALLGSLMELRE